MSPTSPINDIRALSKDELAILVKSLNEPSFRADQIDKWLWQKGAQSFSEMSNLSKSLRERLAATYLINSITEDLVQYSADGTIKTRYSLYDTHHIESVLIPVHEQQRYTVCVSSQVGCSLSCTFCATGQMKRMRNLSAGEIFDQVRMTSLQCIQRYNHDLTNIVFMGMGEPLLNYANVMTAIEKICSPDGLGYSPRRVTISTAGIAKLIKKLADDNSKVNLALSLHAADDIKRSEIMPINDQNNLEALIGAMTYYYQKTKNKISFEYIAFKGYNDSIADAERLVDLCRHFPVLVNIIEYNPVPGIHFEKSDALSIDQFASFLRTNDIMATVRKSRGKDIDAACGQLANKESVLTGS